MINVIYIAWAAPLLQALVLLAWRRAGDKTAAGLAVALTGVSAAGLLYAATNIWAEKAPVADQFAWFGAGSGLPFAAEFGVLADRPAALMAAAVAALTLVVLVFSAAYMRGEAGARRYYGWLGLFCWAMLGVVLSGNLLLLFCFWELVGVSSYFLIGFWREKSAAAEGATAAMLYNRLGDAALLSGVLLTGVLFGGLDLNQLNDLGGAAAQTPGGGAVAAGVLICLGVFAKSAQTPFQAWLPGAMAGPTPVSSLLHAAAMVAAGVFLLLRLQGLLLGALGLGPFIAGVGALTALAAALAACAQTDFKRALAYSTISQLGFMAAAYGAGAPEAAFFHLLTHAVFKCGLFLGAARVILFLKKRAAPGADPQALRDMGGLRKHLPLAAALYAVLVAAIAGAPLTSGYLSKESVLAGALRFAGQDGGAAWLIPAALSAAAALTAYYMARVWLLVFWGEFRGGARFDLDKKKQPAPLLTGPLVLLAAGALWLFWAPLAPFDPASAWLPGALPAGGPYPFGLAAGISLSALAAGAGSAWFRYGGKRIYRATAPEIGENGGARLLRMHFYQKTFYDRLIRGGLKIAATFAWFDRQIVDGVVRQAAAWTAYKPFYGKDLSLAAGLRRFDQSVVDGLVNGVAAFLRGAGRVFQRSQSGTLPVYILLSLALAAAALAWLAFFA